MPTRTLSPEIFTIVITMESPSRMRCDSLRERTSIAEPPCIYSGQCNYV